MPREILRYAGSVANWRPKCAILYGKIRFVHRGYFRRGHLRPWCVMRLTRNASMFRWDYQRTTLRRAFRPLRMRTRPLRIRQEVRRERH